MFFKQVTLAFITLKGTRKVTPTLLINSQNFSCTSHSLAHPINIHLIRCLMLAHQITTLTHKKRDQTSPSWDLWSISNFRQERNANFNFRIRILHTLMRGWIGKRPGRIRRGSPSFPFMTLISSISATEGIYEFFMCLRQNFCVYEIMYSDRKNDHVAELKAGKREK